MAENRIFVHLLEAAWETRAGEADGPGQGRRTPGAPGVPAMPGGGGEWGPGGGLTGSGGGAIPLGSCLPSISGLSSEAYP